MSIRILRMRIISAIMNFYWFHAIALQKLSNERSYKFSWILTLTEVIIFRNLYMIKVKKSKLIKNYWRQEDDRRQMKLRPNTHITVVVFCFVF